MSDGDERRRTRQGPNTDLRKGKGRNSRMRTSRGGSPLISGQSQVDAAARVGEDEGFDSGGVGAREEARGRGRLRGGGVKDLGRSIYKGRLTEMAQETRRQKHHYPATPTPRFSGWSVKAKIRWRYDAIKISRR